MKLNRPTDRLRYVQMRGEIREMKDGKQRIGFIFNVRPGVVCPLQTLTAPSRWQLIDTACNLISDMERESIY